MSTEQENFDDLFKSKLSESEFEFNEANWDKAEELIIQAEKKRKRRRIGFIFFIGMILGVCIMIPFVIDKNDSKKKEVSSKKNDMEIGNETKPKIEDKTEKNNEGIKTSETLKNSEQTASLSNSNNGPDENVNKEVDLSKEKVTDLNSNPIQKTKYEDEISKKAGKDQSANAQKSRSEELNLGESTKQVKEAGASNSRESDRSDIGKETKNTTMAKNENPIVVTKTSDSKKDSTSIVNNFKKDTTATTKDSIVKAKIDSAKSVVKDNIETFKKSTVFSIDVGANYAFGWTNNITKEAAGFNAIFGISVMHQFTKKWSISAGAQYNSLAHLNYSNYSSTNMHYDFGYNQIKTVITPTILYYLAIPIKLQYHFNEKNSLSIGLNTLYLLNTSSKIDTYTQSTFGASTTSVSTKTGYMDGFSTWDIQPALAYRRRIVKCLSLSAEVYYGLMDIKNNSVFGLNKSEHNSGLKLTLSYNISHK
jgi:hypothetical protein